jgi:orotidine-5'-phosphate decarboxylase
VSFDVLQEKILALKNPTVVGLDPRLEYIPSFIRARWTKALGTTLNAAAEAVFEFNCGLMDALAGLVPAVKPQSAFYERFGVPGISALEKTLRYARDKGFYVIGDMKRGDIGSTAQAYADAYLGTVPVEGEEFEPFPCDALTVNAYLGSDGIRPFLEICSRRGKAIFVLVKTSNPSSGELQDLMIDGRPVYETVCRLTESLGLGQEGKHGFSPVGAVAGATYPEQLQRLREQFPNTFFLVPGYGAQGGTAKDVSHAFSAGGRGAVVNSSRGILCAWQKTGRDGLDYQEAARMAALAMRDDIAGCISID